MNTSKSILILILVALSLVIFVNIHKPQGDLNHNQFESKIVSDEFVAQVLDNDLSYKNLVNLYSPTQIIEETLEDEYLKGTNSKKLIFKTDTNDTVQFLKNDFTLLQLDMVFVSSKITLAKDIKIGVDKSLFENKFNKKISGQFTVTSLEGYAKFIFYFEKNKLIKIAYQVEYID